MSLEDSASPSVKLPRSAARGAVLWCALALFLAWRGDPAAWIKSLLAFALVVLAPMALALVKPVGSSWDAVLFRVVAACQPASASLAALSFLLPPGWTPAALCIPWLATAAAAAASAVLGVGRLKTDFFPETPRLAALAFLSIGAGWLVLSRFGAAPMGFVEPIVLLTAVHFHYAGFILSSMVAATIRLCPSGAFRGQIPATLLAAVSGPPVLAAGWAIWLPLKLVGAALIAVAVAGVAAASWKLAARDEGKGSGLYLRISAVSGTVAIGFALAYVLGEALDAHWVDIPLMAAVHGTLNAFGFTLSGLYGLSMLMADKRGQLS